MGTRAGIIVKDKYGKDLMFYKHWDGYPTGILPLLMKFMGKVKKGVIRNNVEQASGHLIVMGYLAREADYRRHRKADLPIYRDQDVWKCGWIEPSTEINDDIAYLYILDLESKHIVVKSGWDKDSEYQMETLSVIKKLDKPKRILGEFKEQGL